MTHTTVEQHPKTEALKVRGKQLLEKVKQLVHEGNARRIIIKSAEGHTIVEIPLTVGVVAAVLAPMWAAVGAIAAIASNDTLILEKIDREAPTES